MQKNNDILIKKISLRDTFQQMIYNINNYTNDITNSCAENLNIYDKISIEILDDDVDIYNNIKLLLKIIESEKIDNKKDKNK
jgi:hypothetical protein